MESQDSEFNSDPSILFEELGVGTRFLEDLHQEVVTLDSDDDDEVQIEDPDPRQSPCQVARLDEEDRKVLLELRENDVLPSNTMADCAQVIAQSVFLVLKTTRDEEFRQWSLEKLQGDDEEVAAENFLDRMTNLVERKQEADAVKAAAAAQRNIENLDPNSSSRPKRRNAVRNSKRKRIRVRRDSNSDNDLDLTVCPEDLVPEIQLLLESESQ